MTKTAAVARVQSVDTENGPGARIRARRTALGMGATKLAKMAEVSREHLSMVENGHKVPTPEWVRRLELAMDRYERETGQDEPEEQAVETPEPIAAPHVVRIKVEGVYGAKALVVEGPVDDLPALEAAVDRIMRRLANEGGGARERPTED